MAASKCGKCDNGTFELKLNEPRNSNVKINLLQCTQCGAVVGMTDFFDAHAEMVVLSKQVNDLQSHLDNRLHRLEAALTSRR